MPGVVYERLRGALQYVQIVHHINGRVRLKLVRDVELDGLPSPRPGRVNEVLSRIQGVRSIRANALARSCIVEYDPTVIPDEAWLDLLAGRSSDSAAVLEQILRDAIAEITRAEA